MWGCSITTWVIPYPSVDKVRNNTRYHLDTKYPVLSRRCGTRPSNSVGPRSLRLSANLFVIYKYMKYWEKEKERERERGRERERELVIAPWAHVACSISLKELASYGYHGILYARTAFIPWYRYTPPPGTCTRNHQCSELPCVINVSIYMYEYIYICMYRTCLYMYHRAPRVTTCPF